MQIVKSGSADVPSGKPQGTEELCKCVLGFCATVLLQDLLELNSYCQWFVPFNINILNKFTGKSLSPYERQYTVEVLTKTFSEVFCLSDLI